MAYSGGRRGKNKIERAVSTSTAPKQSPSNTPNVQWKYDSCRKKGDEAGITNQLDIYSTWVLAVNKIIFQPLGDNTVNSVSSRHLNIIY